MNILAVAIAETPLSSGNIQAVLGFIIVTLAGAIAVLFRLLLTEKDRRFTDQKENNVKYTTAMGEFSENTKLLLAKLDGRERK